MIKVTMGRLRLRLHTQDHRSEALQNRCSIWFRERFEQELAALLTDYASTGGSPGAIDRLTVNVGDIPLSQLESAMSERALKLLKQQLPALPAHSQHMSENVMYAVPDPAAPNRGLVSTSSNLFTLLLRYLDTGTVVDIRAWGARETRDTWLREALERGEPIVEAGQKVLPRVALALRILQPRARQRLVTTWSGPSLTFLAAWLIVPNLLPEMMPSHATWMLPLAALIALQHHPATADRVVWPGVSSLKTALPMRLPDWHPKPGDVEYILDKWLAVLLRAFLPSLREPLLGWLCDQDNSRWITAHLPGLSASVHHKLCMTLDSLPLTQKDPAHRANDNVRVRTLFPETEGETRLLSKTSGRGVDEQWIVASAGLVLIWPLLPRLFSSFGWLNDGHFVDDQARWQAMGSLDWLAWGEPVQAEWRSPCARLLCGIALDAPFEAFPPSAIRQAELDTWLGTALATVALLERCSANDLRVFFLQRTGVFVEGSRTLTIEPEAPDVLLRHLPWPMTNVMLPWLSPPLRVDWNS